MDVSMDETFNSTLGNHAWDTRALWLAKYTPKYVEQYLGGYNAWGVQGLPQFSWSANFTFDEFSFDILIIVMNDPDDHATIDALANDLDELLGSTANINKSYTDTGSTTKIKKILDKVFYGLISVTMFLCFFSLCAAMSANLYE